MANHQCYASDGKHLCIPETSQKMLPKVRIWQL